MTNYRLTLAYEGTRYSGWQKQGNTDNTIQGRLETLLTRLTGRETQVHGCGRTDAGVHARMQVCSFRVPDEVGRDTLIAGLRQYLPQDIAALALEAADERFHARLSCKKKTYLYRINTGETQDVFARRFQWHLPGPVDLEALDRAAALLCVRADFSAFTNNRHMKKSAVRTLMSVESEREGDELRLFFTADGFLYNMVRILTGTLIEVGRGERAPETAAEGLRTRERRDAGAMAPAQGLTLWEVFY